MKSRIVGVDRVTGEDVDLIVEARDEVDAETIAARRNVVVNNVSLYPQFAAPYCRWAQPAPRWPALLAIVIALALLLWAYGSSSWWAYRASSSRLDSPKAIEADAQREQYGDEIGAWVNAKEFVKAQLVSPGSADFGGWLAEGLTVDQNVTDLGRGLHLVRGWVDSQNRFDAKLRTYFTCTVRCVGNNNWRCESIDMSER